MKRIANIAVVGAGASGLFLARCLSESKYYKITVFERNSRVAAKLRASGGGRANIFNKIVLPENYNAPSFLSNLLLKVSPETLKEKFESFGLQMVSDEENRVYPATQYSQTVVDLLLEYPNDNVEIAESYNVESVRYEENKWHINDYKCGFDAVVLASGSPANILPKNREDYNAYVESLNLRIKPLKPSLTGFLLKDYPKMLSGCRTKVIASLLQGDKLIHKEHGEVVFKDEGISGIVVMNLSSYYARLKSVENCRLELNFTYWDEHFDVRSYLKRNSSLTGLLHPKLIACHARQHFDIQRLSFEIKGVYPIETAQVCSGGIDLAEVDCEFRLKKHSGLYATGEMLDVDGVCGGYNLFFAFASALVVSRSIEGSNF